jgi:hypothetical protein
VVAGLLALALAGAPVELPEAQIAVGDEGRRSRRLAETLARAVDADDASGPRSSSLAE